MDERALAEGHGMEDLMATVHDVAAYILERRPRITAMKLQKLIYYAQAWSLVWDGDPLFPERIEAWVNGPVSPDLFSRHRGEFVLTAWPWGNSQTLTAEQQETVNAILLYYGEKPSQFLSDLTHRERPWLEARLGLGSLERGNREITHQAMLTYYGSLVSET
jgi:uncharacterized phage-associated protein